MKKITLILDGEKIEVKPGTTIIEAADSKGIFIPTFCYIKELKPDASCFICAVEVDGKEDLVPACSTEITDGIIVRTYTDRVKEARRTCVELLLSDHLGDCLGPCTSGCPAGIDISGFIKYLSLGENRKALELIKQNMPFPGMLGRVCKKPCEEACRRQLIEEPVAICHLKRFVADAASQSGAEFIPEKRTPTGKRIAIIGAGPAGLTSAYYLQILGHKCTVFDANDAPGGMLRYGIPAYRLPYHILEEEINAIECLGAQFRFNSSIGSNISFDQLRKEYDAVFIAIGAQKSFSLNLKNENSEEVISGISYLQKQNTSTVKKSLAGKKIIVIGGGDVAMDAARTALRSGSHEVSVYCLENRDKMPAGSEEVEAAVAEGIKIHNGFGVKKIISEKGKVSGVEFMRCISVFDENGLFSPKYNEADTSRESCNKLIVAIGQKVDSDIFTVIEKKSSGTIIADEQTMQTNIENVFSGGDCVTGPDSAVSAVAAGRKAAVAIDQFVRGMKVIGEPVTYNHTMGKPEEIQKRVTERFSKEPRVPMPSLPAKSRAKNFNEVEKGFTAEMVQTEARRCMECRCRDAHECRLRSYATMFNAENNRFDSTNREYNLDDSHPDIVYEEHKCIKCTLCVRITEELLGTSAMRIAGRGYSVRIEPYPGNKMVNVNSSGLKKIVENCPVGALTLKNDITPADDYIFKKI